MCRGVWRLPCSVTVTLRRSGSRGLHLFGDCPNKAGQLARNRGGDHRRPLSGPGKCAISSAKPLLSLPCDVTDWFWPALLTLQLLAADPGRKAIAPCRLDQHAPLPALVRPP